MVGLDGELAFGLDSGLDLESLASNSRTGPGRVQDDDRLFRLGATGRPLSRLFRCAHDLSGTTGFFRQHDHPATVAAINKTIAGAKAAGIPVCLGVNSRPAEQRDLIARGVRVLLATSDVELLAGGALRGLAANREAIGH